MSLPFAAAAARADPAAQPLARVREGVLAGYRDRDVQVFKGIPYAAPPLGPLRFRPPEPAASWAGVRPASAYGPAPIQPPPPSGMEVQTYLGAATSEDCLYLNVWRPETPGPHPVFVWIHGGGNMAGAASQIVDGAVFARSGVVCVTVGYRLGAFGFLELGGLLGGAYRGSGVNALRDQVAALRWVQANIEAFGGDPAQVTIGGPSAGGKDVVALMASPEARGLFTSAIVESGGGQTLHYLGSAEAVTDLLSKAMSEEGLALSTLTTLPAEHLNALQLTLLKTYDRPFPFRAVIGTGLLPDAPIEALRRGAFKGRRLLIGTNRDEAILSIDRRSADAPITQHDLANVDVSAARPVAAAYDRTFGDLDPLHRRVRFVSTEEYAIPSQRVAEAVRESGDVWMYRFDQTLTSGPYAGWTPHGAEAVFVWKAFDHPLARAIYGDMPPPARRLGEEMHARWCAFIRNEAPDVKSAAPWPSFDGSRVLVFSGNSASPGEVDRAELALWRDVAFGPPSACASASPRET